MASKMTKAELEELIEKTKQETDLKIEEMRAKLAELEMAKDVLSRDLAKSEARVDELTRYLVYVKGRSRVLWAQMVRVFPKIKEVGNK